MKTISAIIFSAIGMLCFGYSADAQNDTKQVNFIEISGGTALPMGNFAS